jgi:FkbM family methyltransferase
LPGLFERAADALRRRLGMRLQLVPVTLLGHRLWIAKGSLGDEADYDDAWFLACALHAEVIFDVGANQGGMALLALLCPSVKELVLVEPNPEALVIAAENVVRNKMSATARFVCAFMSDVGGSTARLWTVGAGAAGSMYAGHAKTAARVGQSIEVPTVTLDDLMASYAVLPDLVKIDVEGAEGLVLSGAKRCASNHRTRFLVEMHSNPELPMRENADRVLKWSSEVGYSAWYLAGGVALNTPDQIKDRGRCHLLLQPADWPYPSWLKGIPQSAPLELALAAGRT